SDKVASHLDGPIMSWYQRVLRWSAHHRWKTLGAGTLFFALSVVGLFVVPTEFIPPSDGSFTQLNVELPPAARLEVTAAASGAAYRILSHQPEVASVVEIIGGDEFGEVRVANLNISLVKPEQRKLTQRQWEDKVIRELATIPDARIHFNRNGNNN